MAGVENRLKRLEDAPGGQSCTLCGQPNNYSFTADLIGDEEALEITYESGEFCQACERKIVYPVYWNPDRADTTLPVLVCKARPRHREGVEDGA